MSFEDLPADWPARPLGDPVIGADVVDLVVNDTDRRQGGLGFLLCRPEGSLAQPVMLTDVGHDPAGALTAMARVVVDLPATSGFVLAIVRARGGVDDADRALHEYALQVCREHALVLWGTYLVTLAGVRHLPVAAQLRSRSGVA